jgi:hypothetical protein
MEQEKAELCIKVLEENGIAVLQDFPFLDGQSIISTENDTTEEDNIWVIIDLAEKFGSTGQQDQYIQRNFSIIDYTIR